MDPQLLVFTVQHFSTLSLVHLVQNVENLATLLISLNQRIKSFLHEHNVGSPLPCYTDRVVGDEPDLGL